MYHFGLIFAMGHGGWLIFAIGTIIYAILQSITIKLAKFDSGSSHVKQVLNGHNYILIFVTCSIVLFLILFSTIG